MKLPPKLEKLVKQGLLKGRAATASIRTLPDFLILGTVKGGTSSLFRYLIQDPHIRKPFQKELRFFLRHYTGDEFDYRKYFPLKIEKKLKKQVLKKPFITGEATPDYFFFPHVARRVKKHLPDSTKFIVILRDPTDKAFSYYYHLYYRNKTSLTLEETIEKELKEYKKLEKMILNNPNKWSRKFLFYSTLERGKYIKHFKRWFNLFCKEQFLILKTKDLYNNPKETYQKTLDFLDIPQPGKYPKFKLYNTSSYPVDKDIYNKLKHFYKPYNEELYNYLNIRFD